MTTDPPPPPRRSASTWALLLLVWGVGLIAWAFYIALIVMVLARVLG